MAETNPEVMEMVEAELENNSEATTEELFEKATKIDSAIARLTNRQFNARYPLQVKRKVANGRPRRRRVKVETDRNAIRDVLLDFAREVAGADSKAAVVDVIGSVDRYVERVAEASSG